MVAILQIRTGRQVGSAALVANGLHARIDGITSLSVLVAVVDVLLIPIVDSIIGLLITITILAILKNTSMSIFRRMLDSIEPAILAEVEQAPLHVNGVRGVRNVPARWLGHKVHADLDFLVDPGLSINGDAALVFQVKAALADHVPTYGDAMVELMLTHSAAE